MQKQKHIPVLLDSVLELLSPKIGDRYLDLTAGFGGHAEAILDLVGREGSAVLVDRDETAVLYLKNKFKDYPNVEVIHSDFLSASETLANEEKKFDLILADLGISSMHVDDPARGFSFRMSGPLDMRMDQRQQKTASDIVNNASEQELANILKEYGDIARPESLAKKIVQNRPYKTTLELAEVVANFSHERHKKIHPATKTFQSIRIAVNDEVGQLKKSLSLWIDLLATGGKLGVISFHSSEDRLVKQIFKDYGGKRYDATLQTVTKKPVTASASEKVFNPRARSAKLRVTQRK